MPKIADPQTLAELVRQLSPVTLNNPAINAKVVILDHKDEMSSGIVLGYATSVNGQTFLQLGTFNRERRVRSFNIKTVKGYCLDENPIKYPDGIYKTSSNVYELKNDEVSYSSIKKVEVSAVVITQELPDPPPLFFSPKGAEVTNQYSSSSSTPRISEMLPAPIHVAGPHFMYPAAAASLFTPRGMDLGFNFDLPNLLAQRERDMVNAEYGDYIAAINKLSAIIEASATTITILRGEANKQINQLQRTFSNSGADGRVPMSALPQGLKQQLDEAHARLLSAKETLTSAASINVQDLSPQAMTERLHTSLVHSAVDQRDLANDPRSAGPKRSRLE